MKDQLYSYITENIARGQKMLAVLLDPDVYAGEKLAAMVAVLRQMPPDFVFVGGSQATAMPETLIAVLKNELQTPVVLFPGNAAQFVPAADALLNISLVSGRNAEFLIGQHVTAAVAIKNSGIELIPTAYLLIDGGHISSTELVSNTRPIPQNAPHIAVSTALAGEQLGMRAVYLEAGSGAKIPVGTDMIAQVKSQLTVPLLVGGGIRTAEQLQTAFDAGADIAVVGNVLESNHEKLKEFLYIVNLYKSKF